MLGRMETAWKACQGTAVPYKCPFNDSKSEKCEGKRGEATLCEEREKGRLGNQRGDGIAKKHREAERQLTTEWEASLRGSETNRSQVVGRGNPRGSSGVPGAQPALVTRAWQSQAQKEQASFFRSFKSRARIRSERNSSCMAGWF